MVTNFTANQIGDFMFAKLVDPYENIINVTGWNVTAIFNELSESTAVTETL